MTENEPPVKTVRLINPDGSTENIKIGEIAEMAGVTPAMIGVPPNLTLEEISTRFAECAQYEAMIKADIDILYGTMLGSQWGMKPIPLTRWQKVKRRFKNRVEDLKQRAKDIWTILSGGDIHKDCDYY